MLNCSILIPCYNCDRQIEETIKSAIAQNVKEIIIIDDGSIDNSWEIIKQFDVTKLRQSNQGSQVTRNKLLNLASGKWIQFLDADDLLLPGKVESQIYGGADIVFGDVYQERGNEQFLWRVNPNLIKGLVTFDGIVPTIGYLFKADIAKQVKWNECIKGYQETWFVFELLKRGATFSYAPLAKSVYRYGWSNNQISANRENLQRSRQMLLEELKLWLGDAYQAEFALAQKRSEVEKKYVGFR